MAVGYCRGCPAYKEQMKGPNPRVGSYIGDNLCSAIGEIVAGTKGLTDESIVLVRDAEVEHLKNNGEPEVAQYLVDQPDLVFAAHACCMKIQEGECRSHKPLKLNYSREII